MVSIYANGSKGHHKFTLTVTETGTSVDNNTSTISYSFQLSPITKGYDWYNYTNTQRTVSYTVNVNGNTYTGTIPKYDGSSTVTLKSGTQTVSHNSDGTKTISFSFVVTDTTTADYTSGNASKNGTLALTKLERPVTGAAPIITASVVDTNSTTIALTGNSSKLIRYHSNARATMTATPQNGAAINESLCIIRNGNKVNTASSPYSWTFNGTESNVFTFSAEDTRGYVGTATVTANMVNYVKLTCNMANTRPDANGDMYLSCSGNYFNGSFGAQFNSLTVRYSYTGSDGSDGGGDMTVSKTGNSYTAYANLSDLNYQTTYSFVITAADLLESVNSTQSAVKSKPIFHWGENDFAFEVPVNFNSAEEMKFKGDLRLKGDENYGNTLYFGDGSWCYIAEETDDDMAIKAADLNLKVTNLLLNGDSICYGTWTPSLPYASSYSVQQGWYQKIGKCVVIGFNIKANCYSNYNTTGVMITGIPYDPDFDAFGGGVAYNLYVTGGFSFEGWGVVTEATISNSKYYNVIVPRLQPCNNTSAGNLSISSSACYPSGGGQVTLSGTICYMTS